MVAISAIVIYPGTSGMAGCGAAQHGSFRMERAKGTDRAGTKGTEPVAIAFDHQLVIVLAKPDVIILGLQTLLDLLAVRKIVVVVFLGQTLHGPVAKIAATRAIALILAHKICNDAAASQT